MMWNTIANLKENINKIALDVHDDDDDYDEDDNEQLEIHNNGFDSPISDRRRSYSRRFSHLSQSPVSNGTGEIEQYIAQIKRLQESESEIKALSVNYAAILKEKEDHISRLNTENGSLKKKLNETNFTISPSRSESPKTPKGSTERHNKFSTPVKSRSTGNPIHNGTLLKQDVYSNGTGHGSQPDFLQSRIDAKHPDSHEKEKELTDLLEESNRSLAALQGTHESQMKQLKAELEKERELLANTRLDLEEKHKLNATLQGGLKSLKIEKEKSSMEMSCIARELNEKISDIKKLQMELSKRENGNADATTGNLKRVILTLEKENADLKAQSSGSFTGKEELERSLQKLEKELKEACREKDKALQELNRIKQHLLEKESEESDKIDEDIIILEELRQNNELQRAQILHLEKALKLAIAKQEDIKLINHNELQKSKEIIDDLNKKMASCMSTIKAKNVELLNLQTALGQYYAEIEAKERLESHLSVSREEISKLSQLLKDEQQQAEISKREKEEILARLQQAERTYGEGKSRVNKLEEDNGKLRRALEQSMTRINRMSVDSDYFVDRRIVIKLLVTYFQRNHSKEVLDLMVRMLGFSDEDKQRIGGAQQGSSKGVVRGVLGLPGRLVGGILGGGSAEGHANTTSDNQSFADLWVDFLLKETEAREREMALSGATSTSREHEKSPMARTESSPDPKTPTASTSSALSRTNPPFSQTSNPQSSGRNYLHSENSVSEYSTVPLTSSDGNSRISRLLPNY